MDIIEEAEPEVCTAFGRQAVYGSSFALPCILSAQDEFTLLWRGSKPFAVPRVRGYFKARLRAADVTPLNTVYGKIHALISQDRLQTILAGWYGCSVDVIIDFNSGSLTVELESYSEIFQGILEKIGTTISNYSMVTEKQYDTAYFKLKVSLSSSAERLAYRTALDIASSVVKMYKFSDLELLEVMQSNLEGPTFNGYMNMVTQKFGTNYLDAFIMGNIGPSLAKNVSEEFHRKITSSPIAYDASASNQ
ncbi:hypothetical protein IE077_002640, partial [Cardiosporidium cionae]